MLKQVLMIEFAPDIGINELDAITKDIYYRYGYALKESRIVNIIE